MCFSISICQIPPDIKSPTSLYLGEGTPKYLRRTICTVPSVGLKSGFRRRRSLRRQNVTVLEKVDRLHALKLQIMSFVTFGHWRRENAYFLMKWSIQNPGSILIKKISYGNFCLYDRLLVSGAKKVWKFSLLCSSARLGSFNSSMLKMVKRTHRET